MAIPSRQSATFDYVTTFIVTAAASVVTIFIIALLARILDEDAFLDFSLLQRYFGLVAIIANLAFGFGFISVSKTKKDDSLLGIAKLCRSAVTLWSLALFMPWAFYVAYFNTFAVSSFPVLCIVYVWVITQAQYHVSAPYSRHVLGVKAYLRLYVGAKIISAVIGFLAVLISGFYWAFFVVYALVSQVFQMQVWHGNKAGIDKRELSNVWKFSSSRWVEAMLRAMLPMVFVVFAQIHFGHKTAGYVAVIYTFAKSIESLLQPLVVAIMVRGPTAIKKYKTVLLSVLFTLVLSFLLFVSKELVVAIFNMLLSEKYAFITVDAWIVLFSMGPIVSLNILRANYDNDYIFSPLLLINSVCIFIAIAGFQLCDGLSDIALLIVCIQFARWVVYAGVLMFFPPRVTS